MIGLIRWFYDRLETLSENAKNCLISTKDKRNIFFFFMWSIASWLFNLPQNSAINEEKSGRKPAQTDSKCFNKDSNRAIKQCYDVM